MTSKESSKAKARWKILAKALITNKDPPLIDSSTNENVSVRRFSGFGLYHVQKLDKEETNGVWFTYQLKKYTQHSIKIRLLRDTTTAQQLIGFNNTGNICIWPSEEVLADYCVNNKNLFSGKSVCELGGGMTSLAGLQLAVSTDVSEVLLTDGNSTSVDNLREIIKENYFTSKVSSRTLVWSNDERDISDLAKKYDFVICADCLFFTDVHDSLVFTIKTLLKDNGMAILLSPKRSGTLDKFLKKAASFFEFEMSSDYSGQITALHREALEDCNYDPDIHFPLLIILKKK